MPLENFKRAWNKYHAEKSDPKLVEGLEQAWQILQKVAAGVHTGVGKDEPAWPGPMPNAENLLVSHIALTAKWLSERLPAFEENAKSVSDPVPGMYFITYRTCLTSPFS